MNRNATISSILVLTGISVGALWWIKRRNKSGQTTNTNKNTTSMNNTNLPRGYRNNNPLNIRINQSNNWQGKVTPNTDGVFEQFVSMTYGYRAAMSLIRTYITKYNCHTISQIISKWAPNNENNTNGYIRRVCNTTGYTPSTIINPDNQAQMSNLVYAMSLVENGNKPAPDTTAIREAWNLYSN